MRTEKQVNYAASNSYSTLNTYSEKTKNVWLVFHGMGYLSRYFIQYFASLPELENYIIAPQAPSKYYQGKNFKHVGASWLTRENTLADTESILKYVDAVYTAEPSLKNCRLIVLGYSQGVSIATRWLASRKIFCDALVLHSGGIPTELTSDQFSYLPTTTKVTYLYGSEDEYITEARKTEETLRGNSLFGKRLEIIVFKGKHEVNKDFILNLEKKM